jgi:hypothetical protein
VRRIIQIADGLPSFQVLAVLLGNFRGSQETGITRIVGNCEAAGQIYEPAKAEVRKASGVNSEGPERIRWVE